MRSVMRRLCGPEFRLQGVPIGFAAPADTAHFLSFFGVPVRFDAERSALAFDARWLAAPIPNADPYLRGILAEKIRGDMRYAGETGHDCIRCVVRSLVAGGAGSTWPTPPRPSASVAARSPAASATTGRTSGRCSTMPGRSRRSVSCASRWCRWPRWRQGSAIPIRRPLRGRSAAGWARRRGNGAAGTPASDPPLSFPAVGGCSRQRAATAGRRSDDSRIGRLTSAASAASAMSAYHIHS